MKQIDQGKGSYHTPQFHDGFTMDGKASFDSFRIPDILWEKIEENSPQHTSSSRGGRPRRSPPSLVDAIFYRLRTGRQWKAIPTWLAIGDTNHHYVQKWVELGIFDAIWLFALQEYDDLIGLEWNWQSSDCAMTKAPLGHEDTVKIQQIVAIKVQNHH